MSRAFLTTMPASATYAGLKLEVSIAFGADLTSLTGSGWTWTDVTDDVIIGGKAGESTGGEGDGDAVSITIGRADESTVTQTSVMKCTLDNRSGKYINTGLSTYWPYVRRGTPVRVRVTTDNGSTWSVRFQGQAVGFTPSWDKPGRWATVELEASGPLRVLDQGTLPARSVYRTEIPRSPGWDGLIAYWPCEGGDGILQNPAAVPADGKPPIELDPAYFPKATNNPSNAAFPLSGPYQSHMKMGTRTAIPAYTNTGILQVRLMAAIPGSFPTAQWQPLFYMDTTNAAIPTWSLQFNEAGDFRLVGYNASDVIVRTLGPIAFNSNGTSRLTAVTFDNNGTGLDTEIRVVDQLGDDGFFAQNFASTNIGVLTQLELIGPDLSSGGDGTDNALVAHATVQNTATSISSASVINVWMGLPGEAVTDRLIRVAGLHGINVDLLAPGVGSYPAYTETTPASITLTSGPQYWDTLSNVLRETEVTGQGLLYDGLGTGLTYVTRRFRQQRAIAATLTLNASSGHLMEPFDPVDDDQVLFNHYAVTRHNGTRGAEYLDTTGLEGTNIVGDHANSLTVNPNTDAGLVGYAQWGVNVGTISGFRFPTVSFALHTNATLIPQWLACVPQSRIDVTNITSIRPQLSPDPIWLLLEGWTETISMFEWKVVANTSSAEPWVPTRLAAATGSTGDDICHMDTDSSQLNTSAALGATSISVRTNSGPLWVTSAADADSFPFYITVGGLRVQVTAISGASSPQTFTLASPGLPAAKTGSTTPGAGAPISIWRPPVLGL